MLCDVSSLDHDELVRAIKKLIVQERECSCELIIHLAELEERNLHIAAGYSSLYDYCMNALGLDRNKAYKRSRSAKMAKSFPKLIPMLRDGEITESHIATISGKLNSSNFDWVTGAIKGKSKRDAELFMSRIDHDGNITKRQPEVEVRFMASEDLLKKLDRAKGLFSTMRQGEGVGQLIDKCLDLFLQAHDPVKKAERAKEREKRKDAIDRDEGTLPGESTQEKDEEKCEIRYIPARIRHEVMLRDGGKCTYISPDGRRCQEQSHIEFDHILPFCMGGPSSPENLRLRCKTHNLYAAHQIFGREFIEQKMDA